MIHIEDELAQSYLAAWHLHLSLMEKNLLAIKLDGTEVDEELVSHVFRAVHSVKEGAGLFNLAKVRELAGHAEHAIVLLHSRQMSPTPGRISVLLRATDTLRTMIGNPLTSNRADISGIVAALEGLSATADASAIPDRGADRRLRTLLVEDDFTSRLLLQTFLARYGDCHVAVNGREAVDAYREARARGRGYGLICMDIMMPEMDGREAVRQIRALEEAQGILSMCGAKIIMTTAMCQLQEVARCFQNLCDAYLVKPIDLGRLLALMKSYALVE